MTIENAIYHSPNTPAIFLVLLLLPGCACSSLPIVQLSDHESRCVRGIIPFCYRADTDECR